MLIDTTLLVDDPFVMEGLGSGMLRRWGGVVRWAPGQGPHPGSIVRHLLEPPQMTEALMRESMPSLLGGARASVQAVNQLGQVQQTLSSVLQLTQVAAAASVLNVGVSAIGFAYMGYKLHQIQGALQSMQETIASGFERVDGKLDNMSGQLTYLLFLVEANAQEQQRLGDAISEVHRAILVHEIADLHAMMLERKRFPESNPKEALKVASRVRMTLSDQALRQPAKPEPRTLLLVDVSTQGWAAAVASEAMLLLEVGQATEAQQILRSEAHRFAKHAQQWAKTLLQDDQPQLATAYRFGTPRFVNHISMTRVDRIAAISPIDLALNEEGRRRAKKEAELELEMSHSSTLGTQWEHRQLAIAEYLDGMSELSARLDSLAAFAVECETRNVTSRELLPGQDAKPGLYGLKPVGALVL